MVGAGANAAELCGCPLAALTMWNRQALPVADVVVQNTVVDMLVAAAGRSYARVYDHVGCNILGIPKRRHRSVVHSRTGKGPLAVLQCNCPGKETHATLFKAHYFLQTVQFAYGNTMLY